MTNPFVVAIEALDDAESDWHTLARPDLEYEIQVARRVLEAAGKLRVAWVGDTPMVKDNADFKRFLSALPDSPDKGEPK